MSTRVDPAGPSTDVCLTGRVIDEPAPTAYGYRWTIDALGVEQTGRTEYVCGPVQVYSGATTRPPETGWIVRSCGKLEPPRSKRNPADFDLRSYLASRNIRTVMDAGPVSTVVDSSQSWGTGAIVMARRRIDGIIDRSTTDDETRALLASLLLGRRTDLDPEIRARFSATGLSHLLAISGLHVLLVGMVLFGLLRPILLRAGLAWRAAEVARSIVTLGLLLVYAILCGGGPSVFRAVTMAGVFLGGRLLQRSPQTINSLGVAALLLLSLHPSGLFEVGFQLSFSAVAGIVLLRPAWSIPAGPRKHLSAVRWILDSCSVSLAASLATAPTLLFHFGRVALGGILLNIVGIPLTATVLTGGLLVIAFGAVHSFPGEILGSTVRLAAHLLLLVAEYGSRFLGEARVVGTVNSPLVIASLAASLFGIVFARRRSGRWWSWIIAIFFLSARLLTGVARGDYRPMVEVVHLDVRHGDATLVRFPGGRTLLVDAGARNRFIDHGEQTVSKHLDRLAIARIDDVVLTHPHADHIGGTTFLLTSNRIARLHMAAASRFDPAYVALSSLADSMDVDVRLLKAGDRLDTHPEVAVEVLWPPALRQPGDNVNNDSIVLRIAFGATVWLLMGDLEREAEEILCARFGDLLRSSVVKVGHHGSRTSSTPCLVERAAPGWAFISVGAHSGYGLPDEEVVFRWESAGTNVLLTHQRGALTTRSDGRPPTFVPVESF